MTTAAMDSPPRRAARSIINVWLVVVLALFSTVALAAEPVELLVNGTSIRDGSFVLKNDNTRQRVVYDCRTRLVEAGIKVTYTNRSRIDQYVNGDKQTCNAMVRKVRRANNSGGSGVTLLLNGPITSAQQPGWVLFENGNKQWIDPACRVSLQGQGIQQTVTNWDAISGYPDAAWRSCEAIAAMIGSTGGETASTGLAPIANFRANCMGMNDDYPNSWDGGSMVTDAFKNARGPLLNDYTTNSVVDASHWPTGWQAVTFVIAEGDHHMSDLNPWVLLPYEQTGNWKWGTWGWGITDSTYRGRVEFNGVTGHEFNLGQRDINFKIAAGNIPGGSRNRWHLVPKSVAADYARAMRDNNFEYIFDTDTYAKDPGFPLVHAKIKTQMAGFCRVRYMLGRKVNTLRFSGYADDRTKPSHPTFNTPGGDGIPYEWEVWIANHLGIHVYHTDHVKSWEAWRAGDRYLFRQARYFANHLRGNVIREYANEIWNNGWPFNRQTNYVWENEPYADPGRTDWQWLNRSYGQRAYDTAGPWVEAFSQRRQDLDNTIAAHSATPYQVLQRIAGSNGVSFGDRIDSVSGAFYFGSTVDPSKVLYRRIRDNGVNAVIDSHRSGLDKLKNDLRQLMNLTQPHVKKWHLYEGGSHMNFVNYDANNAEHRAVFRSIENFLNSGTYTSMLNEFADWWSNRNGSGELMWFHLFGTDKPQEPWGFYRSSANSTPVYAGSGEFIRQYLRR